MANLRPIPNKHSLLAALSVFFLAAVFYPQSAWSATIITTDIDVNTTWTFDNGPYIIDTAVSINDGATLIIDAQIEVRFRPGTSMSVVNGGMLRVNGDPGKPVVFTSDAVVPAAGDWVSVNILDGGSASFDYCEIKYAGEGGSTGALNIFSTGIVTLDQCDIHDNVDDGIQISGGAGVSPVFTNVIIRNNGDGAVEQGGDTSPEYANVTLTGNGQDGVLLIGDYSTQVELDGSGLNGAPFIPNTRVNINAGGEVTVTAGTTLAFTNEGELDVNSGGDLQVRGAPENPVLFTSNASAPAPGDWNFIAVNQGGVVHGGSSGIGVSAIQMAKSLGSRVFITAGSDEKCAACLELGADLAINYRSQDFEEEVRAATAGKGVDVILDMVGGDYVPKNIQCLSELGRLVFIASLRGTKSELDIMAVMLKRLTITGSTLRPRTVEFKGALANSLKEHIWPLIESGRIKPVVFRTFPLAEASRAHELMESSQHVGKLVLTL